MLTHADLNLFQAAIGRELRTAKRQIIGAWIIGQGFVTVVVMAVAYVLLSGAHP